MKNVEPLNRTNATGNGVPSTEDLIKTQNALLASNAAVMGAVNQMREDVGNQLQAVNSKLDGVCSDVALIKEARAIEAALAAQAKEIAANLKTEAKERGLTTRQQIALAFTVLGTIGSLILGIASRVWK